MICELCGENDTDLECNSCGRAFCEYCGYADRLICGYCLDNEEMEDLEDLTFWLA